MKKPLVLMILDGWGQAPATPDNAIKAAHTPNLDSAFAKYSSALLECSGMSVGLPDGQMGNSEVGHTNIGAGRVVYQELTRISKAIADGDFFQNPAFLGAISNAKKNGGRVHILGLLSDGGVHSHISHILALLELCKKKKVKPYLHCFLDGRDSSPTSGVDFLRTAAQKCYDCGGEVASVCGRYFAMDRDNRWDRVEKAYSAIALGDADFSPDCTMTLSDFYKSGITDEFIPPYICCDNGNIKPTDSVIFANFRPDRARELTRAFVDTDFAGFPREGGAILPYYVCFTRYDAAMPNVHVAFEPQALSNIFGEYISKCGLTQLRIAETEKYAHVTFFFNGGEEHSFTGEDRILVPSPKVATYDLQPTMSAFAVAEKCAEAIASEKYDVIILNFANCDMVGHTGVFEATVKAVEAVDACVQTVLDAALAKGGAVIITADHGNADKMLDGAEPFTAHTVNPVPVILCMDNAKIKNGALCDIAPTMLTILGLPIPPEMTGKSLIV